MEPVSWIELFVLLLKIPIALRRRTAAVRDVTNIERFAFTNRFSVPLEAEVAFLFRTRTLAGPLTFDLVPGLFRTLGFPDRFANARTDPRTSFLIPSLFRTFRFADRIANALAFWFRVPMEARLTFFLDTLASSDPFTLDRIPSLFRTLRVPDRFT